MVSDSSIGGFALLECLAILGLLACLCWLAWPCFQHSFAHYRCQHLLVDLQQEIMSKRIQAMVQHRAQVLRLNTLPASIHWYGFVKQRDLYFSADVFANRLNGYFLIQCGIGGGYRLWLNRLGQHRIDWYQN